MQTANRGTEAGRGYTFATMNAKANPFETDLDRNPANYAPLTPLSFIERAAAVYPERTVGDPRRAALHLAGNLRALPAAGLGAGEARHRRGRHGRGDARQHAGDVRVPFRRADDGRGAERAQHAPRRRGDRLHAGARRGEGADHRPGVFAHGEGRAGGAEAQGRWSSTSTTRSMRARASAWARWTTRPSSPRAIPSTRGSWPADEWNAISLNYTSGTTGNPKGVVYHHRGAYLNAVCNIVTWGMPQHSVYLWTLPMFHCNGWCFPWTMAANAGTNVCLRKVEAQADLRADQGAQGHALLRRADRALDADQRARGDEARHHAQGAAAWWRRRRRRRR